MIKLFVNLVCIPLIISGVFAENFHSNSSNTTKKPESSILSKFHQNDYKIAYEWSEIVRVDRRFFGDYTVKTFKYNRTTTVSNVTFSTIVDFGYDAYVVNQAYKFASNEYRLFPMRLQFNLCEAISKRSMGFGKFSTNGNFTCPILKGRRYHYYNWSPEEASFPPFVPTGKYMLELTLMYRNIEVLVKRCYGSVYRPFVY